MITTDQVAKPLPDTRGHASRSSRVGVVVAAAIPALLYLLYVYHYSVNVPYIDDLQPMPIVVAALHGHLEMRALWTQYSDAREVTGRLVYIAFGIFDHLNERAVMLFSAVVFIITYVLVLVLFRSYLRRPLTPLPVFLLGILWFSLVDFQSALWSTVVNNYLTVVFVVLAICLLLVRQRYPRLLFALGVVMSVLASLSFVEGFLVWPLGLICLLWSSSKRNKTELTIWVIAAALLSVAYFHGYDFTNPACNPALRHCSLTYGLSHPWTFIWYFVMLVGNVVPWSTTGIEAHLWVHGLQGVFLLLAAILVVTQTLRERLTQPNPLPLLLIVFALLFDLITAVGRIGYGLQTAVSPGDSRYTMPNIILLVAIVMYVLAHAQKVPISRGVQRVGLGTLVALLLIQGVVGTTEGLSYGRVVHQQNENRARILVNLNRISRSEEACYFDSAVWNGWYPIALPWVQDARWNHLTVFQPVPEHHYKAEGPLPLPQCNLG